MINENLILNDYKNGFTKTQIARKYHIANNTVSDIIKSKNLPTNKIINKIISYKGFKE